ncbi:MAG: hypothetical protein E5V65_04300 [Mesorhizobium sp.]|nr:MAG: hypothetical protein E5V65_04300 [Mesorhizobium sp.]
MLPEVNVMAMSAVARDTVFALRRQIAKIEGTLSERLEAPTSGAPRAIPGKVRSGFPSGIAEKQTSGATCCVASLRCRRSLLRLVEGFPITRLAIPARAAKSPHKRLMRVCLVSPSFARNGA